MILKCNKCNKCFIVGENDILRINEEVLNKKFNTMLITCTHCQKRTTWHHGIEECNNEVKRKENLKQNSIPVNYLSILNSLKKLEITIFEDEDNFKLYSKDELTKLLSVNGIYYYQISELLGYISTIVEFSIGDIKDEIKLLENSVTIGHENTRVLFIDSREENSYLFVFHPDGGDIEKTSLRINNLIE